MHSERLDQPSRMERAVLPKSCWSQINCSSSSISPKSWMDLSVTLPRNLSWRSFWYEHRCNPKNNIVESFSKTIPTSLNPLLTDQDPLTPICLSGQTTPSTTGLRFVSFAVIWDKSKEWTWHQHYRWQHVEGLSEWWGPRRDWGNDGEDWGQYLPTLQVDYHEKECKDLWG